MGIEELQQEIARLREALDEARRSEEYANVHCMEAVQCTHEQKAEIARLRAALEER